MISIVRKSVQLWCKISQETTIYSGIVIRLRKSILQILEGSKAATLRGAKNIIHENDKYDEDDFRCRYTHKGKQLIDSYILPIVDDIIRSKCAN